MANITNELDTISSGVYGRDIKRAIHSAIDKLNQNGTEGLSDAAANAAVSATKYQSIDKASAEGQEALNWLVENGFMQGGEAFTPMNKDVVRAFIILKRMGLIGNDDSQGASGYKIYTYFRARADANGIPRWAQPTIYKLMHKVGIDGHPLLRGVDDPLTSDPVLVIGDDNQDYPFVYDKTPLSSSEQRGLYNIKLNISSEMLRTLVIIDRSGYFEDLVWTSINCDAQLP